MLRQAKLRHGAVEVIPDFPDKDSAIACANDVGFAECHHVTVTAYGKHKAYEVGEVVYPRFERP